MKKLIVAVLIAAACIMSAQGVWAYTMTMYSVLTDSPGTAGLNVNVWASTDLDPLNPYQGLGYWYYIYDITNISYGGAYNYLTNFDVGIPQTVAVEYVSMPSGWSTYPTTASFGWSNTSGLSIGNTASGFTVRSTSPWTGYAIADAWRPTAQTAFGWTLAPTIVPEPASAMLLGMGLIGLAGSLIRRKFMA